MGWHRLYGYYQCKKCRRKWESAHTYRKQKGRSFFGQQCKKCLCCWSPYRTEELKCYKCGLPKDQCICLCYNCDLPEDQCTCSEPDSEEYTDMERHIDIKKPHIAGLCRKCKAGFPCVSARYHTF